MHKYFKQHIFLLGYCYRLGFGVEIRIYHPCIYYQLISEIWMAFCYTAKVAEEKLAECVCVTVKPNSILGAFVRGEEQ